MIERSTGGSEKSQSRIEKESRMQQWEYHVASVRVDKDYEIPTGKKGMFGDKKKKVPTWVGDLPDGNKLPLGKFLQEMGENAWEIAGVAQTSIPAGGAGVYWYELSHFLYFKRPRMDNHPEK